MATRTWVGGYDNNSVYQSDNWSPAGPVQAGDTLQMFSGTANMAGGNLSGDTLHVGTQTSFASNTPPAVVNLSDGASLTAVAGTTAFAQQNFVFNASGIDTLNLTIDNNFYATTSTTVNIASDSLLNGVVTVEGHNGNLTMNGAGLSAFDNSGASSVGYNCVATIDANVLGIGSFAVDGDSGLSFLKFVGPGESVTLAGHDSLGIGMPHAFLGQVDIASGSESFVIGLAGITNADSYSYANDLLTLFDGNRPIDVLRLNDSGALQVRENSSGVFVGSSTSTLPSDTVALPMHSGIALGAV
jgi:hypothetical protein